MPRPAVFVSYSHKDEKLLKRLLPYLEQLQRDELAEIWVDTKLQGGDRWRDEIEQALDHAIAVALLISQSFLNSKFVRDEELPRIFRRQSEGALVVLPVFLSPSTVTSTTIRFRDSEGIERGAALANLQDLGTPDKTLKELSSTERDRRFLELHDRLKVLARHPTAKRANAESGDIGAQPITPGAADPAQSEPRTTADGGIPSSAAFTGRSKELDRIRNHLVNETGITLRGQAGAGKSQLAAAIARECKERDWLVQWIDAESETGLRRGLTQLANRLRLNVTNFDPIPAISALILSALSSGQSSGKRWLIVVDNAEPGNLISALIKTHPGSGVFLFTSRKTITQIEVPVGQLSSNDAEDLLAKLLTTKITRAKVREVIREFSRGSVSRLPLFVTIAAVFINYRGVNAFKNHLAEIALREVSSHYRKESYKAIILDVVNKLEDDKPMAASLLRKAAA